MMLDVFFHGYGFETRRLHLDQLSRSGNSRTRLMSLVVEIAGLDGGVKAFDGIGYGQRRQRETTSVLTDGKFNQSNGDASTVLTAVSE